MKTRLLKTLAAVVLLLMPAFTFAQAPPLGSAADFVIFSSVGAVTNVGTYKYLTHLTGNVGTNSGSSTNFGNVNGSMHDGDGASLLCASDLLLAYNSLSAAIPDSTLGTVIGNGTSIKAGTYLMPGATSLNLGLTLNAEGNPNAVFIFKTPSAVAYAFTANPNSKIILANGAKACNVFWQVSGAVNMGAGVSMKGSILAHGAISMGAQDTLEGRALTVNGAITISNGALGFLAYTPIGCGSPYLTGPTAPVFVGTGSYAVFATIGSVSDCGTSHVVGDVGGNTVAPTGWNPLFVTGGIHFNDPSTTAAAADLLLVYNNLLGLAYDIELLDPAEFGHNLVLTPHTYVMNAAVIFTDTLILDAMGNTDAVFIIKTYGAFASTPGSQVLLINGTQSKNVYWFCTGAVSITANSNFKGAIIAHDAIDILPGAALDGRAFSTNGAISTCGMNITIPSNVSAGPGDQTVCEGSSVQFIVTASGTGTTFQWRKGSVNLIDGGNISGATNDTLTINPVSLSDADSNYNVIVYAPPSPNDTSANAILAVTPTVGIPTAITVAAGVEPVCQLTNGTTTTTYATTATNNTGFTWSISNPAAGVIVDTTGLMTWANGFAGIVNIQVTASGCNGPSQQVIRTVSVGGAVGIPVFLMGNTSIRCQGPETVIYTATASYSTGLTYILDAASLAVGITIDASTGAVTYTAGWVGVSMITAIATGCSGPTSGSIVVTTNPRPGPSVVGNALVCAGSTGNVYTTAAGMTGYIWVVSAGGTITAGAGTNAITVTWNTAGNQTITLDYTNSYGCNALVPLVFLVTVNANPAPVITGTSVVCQGITGVAYSTEAGMSTYTWTASAGGTITAGAGTSTIYVTWNTPGTQTVSVIYTTAGGCTASTPAVFNVTVYAQPVPTISGVLSLCVNSGFYLYTTESGMTDYEWILSAGGMINYGSGTNQIQVSWIISGTQTISVNYKNAGGCSSATPTVLNITVTPVPNPAGPITGTASVCAGVNGIAYSVAPITNATSYVWTLPPYAEIVSGSGTNSILVNYLDNATSGNITVYGNNICGNGNSSPAYAVAVAPLPDLAGVMNGPTSVCQLASGVAYSVAPIFNATGYKWTFPVGVIVVTGSNTNAVTVDFTTYAVSGAVFVEGTNECGNGPFVDTFIVTVNPVPATPIISATGNTLQSDAPAGNQWYLDGSAIAGATGQTWVAQQSGWYWVIVTLNGCSSESSIHLNLFMVGQQELKGGTVNIYPVPNNGKFTLSIISPTQDLFSITVYSTLGVIIYDKKDINVDGKLNQVIDLGPVFNGIYTVVVKNNNGQTVRKITVNR